MVYNYATDTMAAMTEDNCHTEQWEAEKEEEVTGIAKLFRFLTVFFNWLKELFSKIFK